MARSGIPASIDDTSTAHFIVAVNAWYTKGCTTLLKFRESYGCALTFFVDLEKEKDPFEKRKLVADVFEAEYVRSASQLRVCLAVARQISSNGTVRRIYNLLFIHIGSWQHRSNQSGQTNVRSSLTLNRLKNKHLSCFNSVSCPTVPSEIGPQHHIVNCAIPTKELCRKDWLAASLFLLARLQALSSCCA